MNSTVPTTLWHSLAGMARRIESRAFEGISSAADWKRERPEFLASLRRNLGLESLPVLSTPSVREFGTFRGQGYSARRIGFEILPDCWASAVVFHPEPAPPAKSPAVLYLCGHKPQGAYGYQEHGILWARRGYVCLVLDTIEQADNPGEHHGSITGLQEEWTSLGFTSAGLEVFNSLRALDVLAADPAVDADRIGATGVSGGGVQSFFVAALDERIRAVSSLCGLSSVFDSIGNRHLSDHCDCFYPLGIVPMDSAEIAALVAPRALQFCFGLQDSLFHSSECRAVVKRTEKVFDLLESPEHLREILVDCPHGDHPDFDRATQEWFDRHLADGARPILQRGGIEHPLESVSVFRGEPPIPNRLAGLPALLAPAAFPVLPESPGDWNSSTHLPEALIAHSSANWKETGRWRLEGGLTASTHEGLIDGVGLVMEVLQPSAGCDRLVLTVAQPGEILQQARVRVSRFLDFSRSALAVLEPRIAGLGADSAASRLVRRAMLLLGLTPVVFVTRDIRSALDRLVELEGLESIRPVLHGIGETGAAAVYAALSHDRVAGVSVENLPASHREGCAVPGILRSMDLCHAIGLLAPRRVALLDVAHGLYPKVAQIFQKLGEPGRLLLASDRRSALEHVFKESEI